MEEEKLNELIVKSEQYAAQTNNSSCGHLPVAPNGETAAKALGDKLDQGKMPDKNENKKIDKKIKRIWGNYRHNVLEQIDLENFKKFCELEQIRADNDKKLAKIKRDKDWEEREYWLKTNKGNLEEIGYNTESKPNLFWYRINRGIWYLRKTFSNIPKLTWYIVAGCSGLGLIAGVVILLAKVI